MINGCGMFLSMTYCTLFLKSASVVTLSPAEGSANLMVWLFRFMAVIKTQCWPPLGFIQLLSRTKTGILFFIYCASVASGILPLVVGLILAPNSLLTSVIASTRPLTDVPLFLLVPAFFASQDSSILYPSIDNPILAALGPH